MMDKEEARDGQVPGRLFRTLQKQLFSTKYNSIFDAKPGIHCLLPALTYRRVIKNLAAAMQRYFDGKRPQKRQNERTAVVPDLSRYYRVHTHAGPHLPIPSPAVRTFRMGSGREEAKKK